MQSLRLKTRKHSTSRKHLKGGGNCSYNNRNSIECRNPPPPPPPPPPRPRPPYDGSSKLIGFF